jgi:thiamine biosynthesis protein ThiS
MNLTINGEQRILGSAATLGTLVGQLGMKSDRVAIELNREIVPREQWPQTELKDGDRLEIVHFVGGGSSVSANDVARENRMRNSSQKKLTAAAAVIVSLIAIGTPVVAQHQHNFEPGFNLFSKQQDVQLGQESASQVRKQMTVIQDPVLTEYVNHVGKRLMASREAQESGFPFTFEVVADPSINAFALPGGPMFINTGLLRAVDNEAQLAGVMGHEMSHVILRHGTNQASKRNLIQLPAILAAQVAGNNSMAGQLAQLGIGLGANSVILKFSRTAESQADLMGSHLMSEAGYDPLEMARFFHKLNAQGGHGLQFLSDHPNPDNRERAIQEEARALPQKKYSSETGEFRRMKDAVAQIHEPKPKEQPKQ